MALMGSGYGSECHLLRCLGRHRELFDEKVLDAVGGDAVAWLDCDFDPHADWLDRELSGLDFLSGDDPARREWASHWPQRGNPPNWDAVGRIRCDGSDEWLLVEAKANVQELASSCRAKEGEGRRRIEATLAGARAALGAPADRDWLNGYYQYRNRLAVLDLLNRNHAPARLLFIYFLGDRGSEEAGEGGRYARTCPADAAGWRKALDQQRAHVGLPPNHALSGRVHELFLDVCPRGQSAR
jgi:hypothetical protein